MTAGAVTTERRTATGREFIALITMVMAITSVAIDGLLPAFSDIRAEYGMPADSTAVAALVTGFFLGSAVGPWLYGPASDRYGRKPLVYLGLSIFTVGAVAATLAPTWSTLVIARFVWGIGAGCGRSLTVAMVRDRHSGDEMARMMSIISSVFLLVPVVAPTIGAGLIAIFPWRSVFVFPALLGVAMMVWTRRLPETLEPARRRPFTLASLTAAARDVVHRRDSMAFMLAMVFQFALLSLFIGNTELIVGDVYHRKPWFPVFFAVIAGFLGASSLNNARLMNRLGVETMLRRSALIGFGCTAVFVAASAATGGKPNFVLFGALLAPVLMANQALYPTCNAASLNPLPHVAGTAAAIGATLSVAGGSILGNVASSAFDGSVVPYAVAMLLFMGCANVLVFLGIRAQRRAGSPAI